MTEIITDEVLPRAILAGVCSKDEQKMQQSMDEMVRLIDACDMECVAMEVQNLPSPNPATFLGSGKLQELAELAEETKADVLVLEDNLTPIQLRNISRIVDLTVMDRTSLILEIFSKRAKTKEAKLQVESANLQYMLPRLVGLRENLGRQGGASGAMSNKGSGEKAIELDRRRIEKRISELRRELNTIEENRQTQRKSREKGKLPKVALVGYTNAGKSTLMNAFVEMSGGDEEKKVFEQDLLFATLDTTVRRISPGDRKDFLLSDTVGFVSNLPHSLVQAFRSTLDEVRFADLLLQVVDASDDEHEEQLRITEETLKELKADKIPRITVMNKADLLFAGDSLPKVVRSGGAEDKMAPVKIYISAGQRIGLKELVDLIQEKVYAGNAQMTLLLPYTEGGLLGELRSKATVLKEEYLAEGTKLTADVPEYLIGRLVPFLCEAQ